MLTAGLVFAGRTGVGAEVRSTWDDTLDVFLDRPATSTAAEVWDTDPAAALALLDDLEIADPRPVDYDRVGQFGRSWPDHAGTGCDERNEILARDLDDVVLGDDGCLVLSGVLDPDPYTGDRLEFTRGPDTSHEVQIDHLVPLAWAARQGALDWDAERRLEFANDPTNLIAADGPANGAKGDAGPGDWLPDNEAFHCDYTAQFVTVVAEYELTIPVGDAHVAQSLLEEC